MDTPIICPTREEALATARPNPMSPVELWNPDYGRSPSIEGGLWYPNRLRVGEGGAALVWGARYLIEVRTDGVQTLRGEVADDEVSDLTTSTAWTSSTLARTRVEDELPGDPQSLRWSRYTLLETGEVLFEDVIPEMDLEARFDLQPDGPRLDVPYESIALYRDEHLWFIRQLRAYGDPVVYVHLVNADGSEPLDPEGLRLRRPLQSGMHFENTLEVAPDDGSLWYLSDWAYMDRPLGQPLPPRAPDEPRRGPRAVRVFPDGRVIVSPLLVDTGTVLGTEAGILTGGVWSAIDDEGAYLVHFGIQHAETRTWGSVFARVLPDATVAWTRILPVPYGCVRNGGLLRDPAIQHDGEGGFVFAFTNTYAPYEIRIGRLDRDGDWTLGEEGMLVRSFPPTSSYPDTSLWNMDIDVDADGNYFLLWIHEGFTADCRACAMRFGPDGTSAWPASTTATVSGPRPEEDIGTQFIVRADGMGGAWFSTNIRGDNGAIQHLDATGRPLFWRLSRGLPLSCYSDILPIVAWPDPDVPPTVDYFDGAPYEPRATPLDAGIDATWMDAESLDAPDSLSDAAMSPD